MTATENALWQQVHSGSAEVRQQALNDLAALRGTSSAPGGTEIGVRDGLQGGLSQLPEVRVVPGGNSPAVQIDADEVRRALGGFDAPVTTGPPLTVAPGTQADTAAPVAEGSAGGDPQGAAPGTSPESAGVDGDVPENPAATGDGDPEVAPPEGTTLTPPAESAVASPETPAETAPGTRLRRLRRLRL